MTNTLISPVPSITIKHVSWENAEAQKTDATDVNRIRQKLHQVSNKLNSQYSLSQQCEVDRLGCRKIAIDSEETAAKFERLEKKFSECIAHISNKGTQLRLKNGYIKPMEYQGRNPFKRGSESSAYTKQAAKLREALELPAGMKTDAKTIHEYFSKQINSANKAKENATTDRNLIKTRPDETGLNKITKKSDLLEIEKTALEGKLRRLLQKSSQPS